MLRPLDLLRSAVALLIVTPLVFSMAGGPSAAAAQGSSATGRKVIVDSADPAAAADARQRGGVLLVDYGAFALWSVPEPEAAALRARTGATVRDDLDTIWLRGGASIDTRSRVERAPAGLRQVRRAGPQLWLVQFVGPIKEDWLDELRAAGLALVFYMPQNAYVVWGDGAALASLDALAAANPVVQFTGAYHPAYRLEPSLQQAVGARPADEPVAVTVQFYTTAAVGQSLAALRALGGRVHLEASTVATLTSLSLDLPAGQLPAVASWPDVFNVEPYSPPRLTDEAQGQLVAGNLTTTGGAVVPIAQAGGYLAWLASEGFPTTPASYPVVDVVDDGIDDGTPTPRHPDFRELGSTTNPDRLVYNQNCTTDASANGVAGHGNINASIAGGYNNLSGAPHQDGRGFRLGLGISPYGRLAGTKIFRNSGASDFSACGGSSAGVVLASYNAGASIVSNSWGQPAGGGYSALAQAYDALTRDAAAGVAGNQQMLHVFGAGNQGPGGGTLTSPGTAKNVLTVGASENVRDEGTLDGCLAAFANDADDIAGFSGRGPTADGRAKPDVVAPGTHIQGAASQDPGFDGSGVCGGYPKSFANRHVPAGQTLYTWSSGTSHATPAVAGAASLVYNYYSRVLRPGQTPSPAMLKALLLNSPRYLDGVDSGGTLPSVTQGWGGVNLGQLFDGTPRGLVDQAHALTASGQQYVRTGSVADGAKPFRVTLVWTDAPGSTTGSAYVNDLDLEVTVGGHTYRGNVFAGATSTPGGAFDVRNNVESVFLPTVGSGQFSVRVIARNLAGDGVPGNTAALDQDFALVVTNGTITPRAFLGQIEASTSDATGNNNGAVDPGETFTLRAGLQNSGDAAASGVGGTLTLVQGNAVISTATSAYPGIAPGATATNATPYRVRVAPTQVCGSLLTFRHTVAYDGSESTAADVPVRVGRLVSRASARHTSADVPKAIPDNSQAGVVANLPVSGVPGMVADLDVRVTIDHTWTGDLVVELISPSGTVVPLARQRGGSANNYTNTVFDDGAQTAIADGASPFTGSFRPESPLSVLTGEPIDGTWQLRVTDLFGLISGRDDAGTGSLTAFALDIVPASYQCVPAAPDLSLTKAHAGTGFAVGQTGTYTLTVRNGQAAGPTAEPVVVTDTLPAGLTLVSGTGAGWSCGAVGQLVTCTMPGPLAPGSSSALTLTVGVGQAAAPHVTNTATASTVGEVATADNGASVVTPVSSGPCAPRPNVRVTTARRAPGQLNVTIEAGRAPLQRVHFRFAEGTTARNAVVDIPADPANATIPPAGLPGQTTDFTLQLNRPSTTFVVRQAASGPFTLPLVVEDGCGAWETFVGAGS